MTFTQDELAAVVGSLYLENVALRKELAKVQAEKQEKKPTPLREVSDSV